jgi:hypothetical protein
MLYICEDGAKQKKDHRPKLHSVFRCSCFEVSGFDSKNLSLNEQLLPLILSICSVSFTDHHLAEAIVRYKLTD